MLLLMSVYVWSALMRQFVKVDSVIECNVFMCWMYIYTACSLISNSESTFVNHLIEPDHTCRNINNNMEVLYKNMKDQKLDELKQLEIYKPINLSLIHI